MVSPHGRRWIRSSGKRRKEAARQQASMLETLEPRMLMSVSINPLPSVYGTAAPIWAGKSLILPLTAQDTTPGARVNYAVSNLPAGYAAYVRPGSATDFLTMHTNLGDMTFQLFPDIAPNTVAIIEGWVRQGRYTNVPFHRIITDFMAQGGDFGNGTDPSTVGNGIDDTGLNFPDEFNTNALFTGEGQLAMANSGPDTNGSQFFITYDDPNINGVNRSRHLDFVHTIWGQLVRGFDTLAAILAQGSQSGTPSSPVTLLSTSIVQDLTDATLTIVAPANATGTVNFTVIAADTAGASTQTTYSLSASADTVNDAPFFRNDLPNTINVRPGTPVTLPLQTFDIEGDPVLLGWAFVNPDPASGHPQITPTTPPATATQQPLNNAFSDPNGLTITPNANFTGSFMVGVYTTDGGNTQSAITKQFITFNVDAGAPTAAGRANDVYGNAGTTQTLTVTFSDPSGINVSSLVNNNAAVGVFGPNGYAVAATYVSIDNATNGTTRTVTYRIPAPGGNWDANDVGTYRIVVLPGQVKDVPGNAMGASNVGDFFYSPVYLYNERYYLANNPDIGQAVGAGQIPSGWWHFVNYGQFEGRAPSLYYNEALYLSLYPDIRNAVANHQLGSGFQHFFTYGAREGRVGNPFFNEREYKLMYPDVANGVATGALASGLEHYVRFGEREGRNPSVFFNTQTYAARNPDVVQGVAQGFFRSLFEHFYLYGQREGRVANTLFSETYYRSTYSDIGTAVQNNAFPSGYYHYVLYGQKERRNPSADFNENFYLATYPDVAQGVAAKAFTSGFEHYLLYGRAEGRQAHA